MGYGRSFDNCFIFFENGMDFYGDNDYNGYNPRYRVLSIP